MGSHKGSASVPNGPLPAETTNPGSTPDRGSNIHTLVEFPGAYYNTKQQVSELESLLKKLPDASGPLPPGRRGRLPGSARQLESQQVQELIAGHQAGATRLPTR